MAGRISLRIESLSRGRISYLRLYGTVDETFNPSHIIDAIDGREVILNLKAVTRFSSFGVREWVHCFERLSKHVDRLLFVECSPACVGHLNIVENFAGPAQVVSVQVPYYCENCKWDTETTCELAANTPPSLDRTVLCQRCGAEMVFDEDATYFSFLNGIKVATLDEDMQRFLRDFSDVQPPQGTGTKRAEGALPLTARSRALARDLSQKAPVLLRRASQRLARAATRLGAWAEDKWKELNPTQRAIAIGSGAALLLVLVFTIVIASLALSDDTDERLARVSDLIEQGQLALANGMLSDLESEGVPTERLVASRDRIAALREKQATDRVARLLEAFRAGNHRTVIAEAAGSDAYETDPAVCYALAESHRAFGQIEEADRYWTWIAEHWPHSVRYDDALFWRAERLAAMGADEEATLLYERILKMRRSNFKRSAKKRLRALARGRKKR